MSFELIVIMCIWKYCFGLFIYLLYLRHYLSTDVHLSYAWVLLVFYDRHFFIHSMFPNSSQNNWSSFFPLENVDLFSYIIDQFALIIDVKSHQSKFSVHIVFMNTSQRIKNLLCCQLCLLYMSIFSFLSYIHYRPLIMSQKVTPR